MVASHHAPGLLPLLRPIAELTHDPANARSHPERNLDAIKESLSRFGQQKPIVVARDGTVKYARYGRSVTEQPDIEALWAAAAP